MENQRRAGPPRLAERLMRSVLRTEAQLHGVIGDLREEWARRRKTKSRVGSDLWFWGQAVLVYWRFRTERRKRSSTLPRTNTSKFLVDTANDSRLALRTLAKRPMFASVAIITISLGIGAATAIFAVVHGVLLRPLPYLDSDELVTVSVLREGTQSIQRDMSPPDVADLKEQAPSLESLVGYQPMSIPVMSDGDVVLLNATRVSEGLLAVFGVSPTLGRDLTAGESGFGAPPVVVISHSLWRERFGLASDVVGRSLEIGNAGTPFEIIGVAPQGFDFPGNTTLWIPHRFNSPQSCGRACHTWWTVGRLSPGATVTSLTSEVRSIASSLALAYPETNAGKGFVVETLHDQVVGRFRARLWILFGAVSVVLLIAGANVTNLLLVRAYGRKSEFAIRTALGAGRGQLTRLLLVESAVLAAAGGALALPVAYGLTELFRHTATNMLPRIAQVSIDETALLFSAALVLAVTLLTSVSPTFHLSGVSPAEDLGYGGRGSDGGIVGRRFRSLVIGFEVALTVILLSGAGLLARSFAEMYAVNLGFESSDVLRISMSKGGDLEEVRTFFRTLEDRVASLPGVEAVGSIYGAPLGPGHTTAELRVEGRPAPEPGTETFAGIRAVSPNYLETARIPLLRGRLLVPSDDVDPQPVAVVNETFVKENFPTEDPMGRQLRVLTDQGYGSPVWTIVGVVGDIHSEAVTQEPIAEVYVPHGHFGPGFMTLTVKSVPGSGPLLPAIRSEIRALDPRLPVRHVETVSEAIGRETAPTRVLMLFTILFAVVAAVLAGIGLYGVLAYLVSRQVRDIGVRMALGAQTTTVAWTVLSDGFRIVLIGAAVGIGASILSGRVLGALLFNVHPNDPFVLVAVMGVLMLIGLAAMLVPAVRASRVDPAEALRVL